jgi:hypothetical protein
VVNVPSGDRGDLLVRSFYTNSMDCIFDIRIQDLDAPSYLTQDPEKCLIASENEKKRKYQQKCHEQRRTFVPFVVSVDGLLAPEAINSLKQIARKLSDKWWAISFSLEIGKLPFVFVLNFSRAVRTTWSGRGAL